MSHQMLNEQIREEEDKEWREEEDKEWREEEDKEWREEEDKEWREEERLLMSTVRRDENICSLCTFIKNCKWCNLLNTTKNS